MVLAVVVALWPVSPVWADFPARSAAAGVGLFAPDWKEITNRNSAQWAAAGRDFAVVMGTKELYAPHLAELRAGNPDVSILMYNTGPYLLKDSPIYTATMQEHPEYFARDKNGNLITVKQQPRMTLMDQGNSGWRDLHVTRLVDALEDFPFDGVQVDCMGWGAVKGYTTAVPIDLTTGLPYTVKRWLELSVVTLNSIKDALGSKLVMYNGLGGGVSYRTTKILASSDADGGMAEGFLREAMALPNDWPSLSEWKANLKMLTDMTARGKSFFAWTKTWHASTTDAQRAAWNNFALGTYLLGKGDYAYYNFLPTTGRDRTSIPYPNLQAELGVALGPYSVFNGIYTRQFQHGNVRVDPVNHSATITVAP